MFPVMCDYIANQPLITYTKLIFSDLKQYLELLSGHFKKFILK